MNNIILQIDIIIETSMLIGFSTMDSSRLLIVLITVAMLKINLGMSFLVRLMQTGNLMGASGTFQKMGQYTKECIQKVGFMGLGWHIIRIRS